MKRKALARRMYSCVDYMGRFDQPGFFIRESDLGEAVERMAKEIYIAWGYGFDWDHTSDSFRGEFRGYARAALTAILPKSAQKALTKQ
jgi:hypothetical protein